jgi:hypothetical protein
MSKKTKQTGKSQRRSHPQKASKLAALISVAAIGLLIFYLILHRDEPQEAPPAKPVAASASSPARSYRPTEKWLQRAYAIDDQFRNVYTPCWEGAYGAIGEAYLFAATKDSSFRRFNLIEHDLRNMCTGTWVDDRAWVCLAEMYWWEFTGRTLSSMVEDAKRRYLEARNEGRLSNHEGFWSWYNWPPNSSTKERVFTNSNMNQMANVACWLYEATGEEQFLNDALLVWKGDRNSPGIEKTLYKGDGAWRGKPGLAAFGKQLPWEGAEYCSIGASLFHVTKDPRYKRIVVATARRIADPAYGWIDHDDFYQIRMDGNGAFVNYLLDAYALAPEELGDILEKTEKMLEHVWTNHGGTSSVTLHRESDHGIRNGWNPRGGEDGYGVNEIGTVHAQAEALRAFGIFAYYKSLRDKKTAVPEAGRRQ